MGSILKRRFKISMSADTSYNDPALTPLRRELRREMTDAERLVWSKLRIRQINGLRFLRQYGVGPYILDFYCPVQRLAIELDGGQHNDQDNMKKDAERTRYLEAHDIKVIRFWNNDVLENIDGVMERVFSIVTPPNLPAPRTID